MSDPLALPPPLGERKEWIGQSVLRLEDPPLVAGRGAFAGDINFPHQLYMRVVRAAHAHGRIVALDTAAARALSGVYAVWTAADIAEVPPIDFREGSIPALDPYRQPVLASDRVRYVGEPIAAVFAADPYIAEDAADLVTAEIEELPPLLDGQAAPVEFSPGHSSEAAIIRQGYGDVDAVFRDAPHVVELELAIGRHSGVPLETRGAIGRYDAARDILELHGAAKVPHRIQELLSRMLDLPPSAIQVHESDVGGGFGVRGELYPEDVLVCVAAKKLNRPIKWIEDRREHLIAANHSRQQLHQIRAAVDADGVILAIDDRYFHDQGAYVRTHAARVVHMTAGILPGPYRVPAYRSIGHFRLTNKTPAATYRAPGRYETTFVRERLVDAIAQQLKIDRIEIRRRNAITAAEMPYPRPLEALGEEIHYDTGDYIGLLDKLFATIGWDALNAEVKKRQAAGELVGIGVAMFVEKSGLGPTDGVNISIDTSGMVEVVTGGASIGQGFETVMAQVAADALGVDYRNCRVIHGQTDRIAFGIGAHASRATVMTASATHIAALNVRKKALDMAAELLQTTPDALDIVRRRDYAQRRQARPVDQPRRDREKSRAHGEGARRPRRRDCRPRAGSRPSIRSIRMAATSPWCASTATPAALRSSAIASLTTLAAPSIRRWCTARSSAAMRKASAARSTRSSLTASTAIRSPSPSPIIFSPRCTTRRRRKCCCARTTPRRSIRSASRAPARAASPASAPPSLRRSTTPSAFPARCARCR